MTPRTQIFQVETVFSSKELPFLRVTSPSGQAGEEDTSFFSGDIPGEYLSDNLAKPTPWMEFFALKLKKADIPHERFLCAVMKQDRIYEMDKKHGAAFDLFDKKREEILNRLFQETKGFWFRLGSNLTGIAIWHTEKARAEATLFSIQEKLATAGRTTVSAGACCSPCLDFPRQEIFHNAIKALDHGAFFGPGNLVFFDSVSLNISGDRLYQLGKIEQAAEEYQKGLAIDSSNTNLLNSQGVCFGLMNHLDSALEAFKKAAELNPDEIMAFYNAGLVCAITNRLKEGLDYLEQASRISSQVFEIELTAGKLNIRAKQFDRAMGHIKRAAALNPHVSAPFKTLGDLYIARGNPAKAEHEYNRAIKINPCDAGALSGLALAFELQESNPDLAVTFARESVALEPDNPVFRSRLGNLYSKQGQQQLAEKELEQARDLIPLQRMKNETDNS
ncbi:MAG: tetratricopeptide repeat protein [Desulfobacteraceae bacterium]